jgi:hypothetical protein
MCVAGSRPYQPVSEWEKGELEKANLCIYPGDVREEITIYQSTIIAWPGIVKDTEVYQTDEGINIVFILEHHYYDWIEDFSVQQEKISLSPRGEGLFTTEWLLKNDTTQSQIEEVTEPGYLLIVYGTPVAMEDDSIIDVHATYIRGVGKEWYTTETLDYGRFDDNTR